MTNNKIIKRFCILAVVLMLLITYVHVHPVYADSISNKKLVIHDIYKGDEKGTVVLEVKPGDFVTIVRPVYTPEAVFNDELSWKLQEWYVSDIAKTKLPDYQYKAVEKRKLTDKSSFPDYLKPALNEGDDVLMAVLGFYMPAGDLDIYAEYSTASWSATLTALLPGTTVKNGTITTANENRFNIPTSMKNGDDTYHYKSALWESSLSNYQKASLNEDSSLTIYGNTDIYATYTKKEDEHTLTIDGKDMGKFKEGQLIIYSYDETENGEMPGYTMYFDSEGKEGANLTVKKRTTIDSKTHKKQVLIFRMPSDDLYIVFSRPGLQALIDPIKDTIDKVKDTDPIKSLVKRTWEPTPPILPQSKLKDLAEIKSGEKKDILTPFKAGEGVLIFKDAGSSKKVQFHIDEIKRNRDSILDSRDTLDVTNYFVKHTVGNEEHLYLVNYSGDTEPDFEADWDSLDKVLLY